MSGSLELDAFCAKQLGLSYGQYMALTDEKERAKLYRKHKKAFEAAQKSANKKRALRSHPQRSGRPETAKKTA